MKCIHCGSDTKYKDRQSSGGRCAACQHPFAFEPKADSPPVSDGLFARVIKDVSGDDTVFFTERNLWYEFNRRLSRKAFWHGPWGWVAGGGVAGAAFSLLALGPLAPVGLVAGVCTLGFGAAMSARARKKAAPSLKIPFPDFRTRYLAKWLAAHGPIEKLLPAPDPQSAPASPSGDVTAYSFDRALVTETAEIAALLVANNFHFENNCAILSRDGYPFHNAPTVMAMLRRNPQLSVFAIHDASVPGGMLAPALRGEPWFPDRSVRIFDLGLRPRHAEGMFPIRGENTTCPPVLRDMLTPDEVRWLEEGRITELAVLRPARLMRAVYQGFSRANQSDGGYSDTGDGIWIYGYGPGTVDTSGGAMDAGASDSFG